MPARICFWIDAFADAPLSGNPCLVVFDADDLPIERRIALVAEMRLNEGAFLVRSDRAAFGARYYTPAGEILFAGHPTIAAAVALRAAGLLSDAGVGAPVETTLEIGAGVVPLTVRGVDPGGVDVEMRAPEPQFGAIHAASAIAGMVGLTGEDILAPPQTVSIGGTAFAVTLLRSHDALRRAVLNVDALRAAHAAGVDFGEPYLATLAGATPGGDTFSRLLLAPPEPPEDAFTGSATACLTAYLWRRGLLPEGAEIRGLRAEQGHWMGRPGQARATPVISGTGDRLHGVRLAGRGGVVLRGELLL